MNSDSFNQPSWQSQPPQPAPQPQPQAPQQPQPLSPQPPQLPQPQRFQQSQVASPYGGDPTDGAPMGQAPVNNPFMVQPKTHGKKKWVVMSIVFAVLLVVVLGLGIWLFLKYSDLQTNYDNKVTAEVSSAKRDQAAEDADTFSEKEKEPNRLFAGPEDYGSLSFHYPKTWSIYVANDTSKGGTYSSYFNPVIVPPVAVAERFALRVTIEDKDYDNVVESYKSLVSTGKLSATGFQLDAETSGTRLDGDFSKDIRGSAVIFKIRDKTATIRTDAETFKPDFEKLIKTVTFNK